jgi:hypothetical protein
MSKIPGAQSATSCQNEHDANGCPQLHVLFPITPNRQMRQASPTVMK